MSGLGKSIQTENRLPGAGGGAKLGVIPNGYRIPFGGYESILEIVHTFLNIPKTSKSYKLKG